MSTVERIMRRELRSLRAQKEKIDKRITILERAYAELRGADAVALVHAEPAAVSNGSPRTIKAGSNRALIVSMLESRDGPMTVREIATKVYQNGQIKSTNEYKGVYNIVQTVLRRNKRTTFAKVGPGQWDLRVRRVVKLPDHINLSIGPITDEKVVTNARSKRTGGHPS